MFDIVQELRDIADLHYPDLAAQQHRLLTKLIAEFGPPPQPLMAKPRHPKWPKVRGEWLTIQPFCQACGGTKHLEVHHVLPYWQDHSLELSLDNLITLCDAPYHNCHFILGHLLNWSSWNENVREDAAAFLQKVRSRP